MYDYVDSQLGISKAIANSGLKEKGFPLDKLVRVLVCGTLSGNTSVSSIVSTAGINGFMDYVGNSDAHSRTYSRAVELLGSGWNAKPIYRRIVGIFAAKHGIDFSQVNIDSSSSYFTGTKCSLAALGYSRDHRPDKPQIKLNIVQCGSQQFAFDYFIDSGNVPDVKQFESDFSQLSKDIPRDSLLVFDKGMNSEAVLRMVDGAGFSYITAKKMAAPLKKKITSMKKPEKRVQKGVYCAFEKTDIGYDYYFFSKKLAEQQRLRRERRVKAALKNYNEKVRTKGRRAFRRRKEVLLDVDELEEVQIVTERHIQKRLVTKPLPQIEKELMQKDEELDGWFVLTSNKRLSSKKVLKAYRQKDSIEKLICSIKNVCHIRPFHVWKDECVIGSVFITMLANFILGVFRFLNGSVLCGKSSKTVMGWLNSLTASIRFAKNGVIRPLEVANITGMALRLFPDLLNATT